MSSFSEGGAMVAAAKCFWLGRSTFAADPTKGEAMAALDVIAEHVTGRGGHYEMQDGEDLGPESDLGRLVAIAFEAEPDELLNEDEEGYETPWEAGPLTRFEEHYGLL